jgi:hypothetical protein
MKRKKKTLDARALSNKVAERLQLLRRLEHSDDNGFVSCVTCGTTKHFLDGMQGGHFIERSKSPTKLREENIWPQCAYCNAAMGKFGKSSVAYDYYKHMVMFYGEDYVKELIEESKRQDWKWSKPELEETLKGINERIREHEERVGR